MSDGEAVFETPEMIVRRPEAFRWVVALSSLVVAAFCLWAAVSAGGARLFTSVLGLGVAALFGWFGHAMWTAPGSLVRLTARGLEDDDGALLCPMEDIVAVETGFNAFKPSNGFVATLRAPGPRGWSPGLWWRIGRRFGVGGATPGRQAKHMGDALKIALHIRDNGPP